MAKKKTTETAEAPGWEAIDGALRTIYGDTEPLHWGTIIPAMLGGNDPLQGISAYRSDFGGKAHWHFVTYGYSELYAKESEDKDVSGFGYEMTIRVIAPEAGRIRRSGSSRCCRTWRATSSAPATPSPVNSHEPLVAAPPR